MGEGTKGPTFNGGYYAAGPVNPPVYSPRRRGSCLGCALKFLLKLIFAVVIVLGIIALVLWLVLRPSEPKFYVDTVVFTNGTNSTTSNLDLGMTIRNGNRKIGLYYDTIQVYAHYAGQISGFALLPEFYQGHKNTTTLNPVLSAESLGVSSNSGEVAVIEVRLRSKVRFKVGKIKTKRFTLKVKCPLSVPVSQTAASTFYRKRCDVDFDR